MDRYPYPPLHRMLLLSFPNPPGLSTYVLRPHCDCPASLFSRVLNILFVSFRIPTRSPSSWGLFGVPYAKAVLIVESRPETLPLYSLLVDGRQVPIVKGQRESPLHPEPPKRPLFRDSWWAQEALSFSRHSQYTTCNGVMQDPPGAQGLTNGF